jgi:hypothetical protein
VKRKKDPNINYEVLDRVKEEFQEEYPQATDIRVFPNGNYELVVEVWGKDCGGIYTYPASAYKVRPSNIRRVR